MKFLKLAMCLLFILSVANLGFSCYMYKELKKTPVIDIDLPQINAFRGESAQRDAFLFQANLMTHHRLGIHVPGSQNMCPMCNTELDQGTEALKITGN
jgi:hypothetical protein